MPPHMEQSSDRLMEGSHGHFGHGGKYYTAPPTAVEKSRWCTDFWFIIVFLAAYAGLGVLGLQVVEKGNLEIFENFAHGRNFNGARCGVDAAVKDFPLTFFTVAANTPFISNLLIIPTLTPVCTSVCPTGAGAGTSVARLPDLCQPDARDKCAWYGASTIRVANYCLDVNLLSGGQAANLETALADLGSSVGFIIVLSIFALVLGFTWLLVIRTCANVFIWVTLVGAVAGLGAFGFYIFSSSEVIASKVGYSEDNVKIVSYVIWALDVILALVVVCSIRTIAIAASILKTSALFLADVKSAMLLPLVGAFWQMITLVGFLLLIVNCASLNAKEALHQPTKACTLNGMLDPFCVEFDGTGASHWAMLYVLLMYFWSLSLIHAFCTFTTAYAAGIWYFCPYEDGTSTKALPGGNTFCDFRLLFKGFCVGFKHIGSLAMGSLVMAICKLLVFLCKWAKPKEGSTNPAMKCLQATITCLAVCLDRTCRLITDNAYIQMALAGKGFCTSCCIGLGVCVRNPVMSSTVTMCSRLFGLVGPCSVMATSGLLAWFLLDNGGLPHILVSKPLDGIAAPMIAVLLIAWLVGDVMMHPYSVVSMTIMHAFVADREADEHSGLPSGADGHGFRSHTPAPLQQFVRDHCGSG